VVSFRQRNAAARWRAGLTGSHMHSLSYDEGRALLTAVQQGYWSMADFRAFERDFRAHDASIRAKRRSYRVLALCHDFPVQSAEIS